jgi:DNA invertase Pin-like site-specific DNA recombinase
LARSTRDLLNTIAMITEKNAGFRVLDNPAMDTTSAHGRLLLNILGSIAEFERELIRSRTGEGRARAKLRGVRFGRKPSLTQYQKDEALKRRENGETCVDIARSMNVSHSTISRL